MATLSIRKYLKNRMEKIPPYFNLKFLIFNLKICGSWPPIHGNNILYKIWSVLTLSLTLGHFIFVQTAFVVVHWDDSEEVASAMSMLINNYVHFVKVQGLTEYSVCVVLRNQKRIKTLLDYADEENFTCDDPETVKKLRNEYCWAAFTTYAKFQSAGLFACVGWTVSSAVRSLKDKNDRVLPMNSWYPYDSLASPFYEATFVLQVISVFNLCVHNISLDGLIVSFMAVVGSEFEILKTRIKEVGDNAADFQPSECLTTNRLEHRDVDEIIYRELMLCVEHHLAIMEYAKEFEDIFHFSIFLQFLDNCCVICMSAFALSQLSEYNLTNILSNFMYLAAIIYQLFMYCYFGNIVSFQKELKAAQLPKVFNTILRQNRIKRLLDVVKSDVFSRHNSEYENLLRSYTSKGVFHHVAYQSFGTVAVICWGFTPIGDLLAGRSRRLPMEGWYPYNVTKTPAFELTCIHQTLAVIIACFHNIAEDTLVTGLITVACCQLEILKSNLVKIGGGVSHSVKQGPSNPYEELKLCVKHHNAIIDFTKEIEAIFGTTVVVQFSVNSLIICLNAFHITQMKVFVPAELIGMTMYTCCMTYQIFIYCWHGNEVVRKSESVAVAAYSGNWWRCGERYKRGLRLLMARANRPLTLKAGNLLTLSLQTFVTILKTSYSFFTVLQSSTGKM